MKNLLNPRVHDSYQKLYDLIASDPNSQDLKAKLDSGAADIVEMNFYLRKKLTSSTLKPFQDLTQARETGITNYDRGKFPFKFVGIFTHFYLGHAFSASDVNAQTLRYGNNIYDPTVENGAAISDASPAVDFGVKTDFKKITNDLLNSEISLQLGNKALIDRVPASKFFRESAYDPACVKLGNINPEAAFAFEHPVLTNSDNTPLVEWYLNSGGSVANYHYFEYTLIGLGIRTAK
jgi:hypothetical protein